MFNFVIMKFAAIDIGTNAARLLIANVQHSVGRIQFQKLAYYRVPLRLGEEVFDKGKISSAKALLESALQKDSVNMETALHYVDQIGGALRTLRALVDETLMFMGSSFTRKHLNVTQLDISKVFNQFLLLEQRRKHGLALLEFQFDSNLVNANFYSDEYVFTQAIRQMMAFAETKESSAGRFVVKMRDEKSLNLCIELLEWPEWMVKGGQLEPQHDRETVVPFKDDYLPFSLLLTKRVIRLINGRLMIKNRGDRHWLCLDFPSMKEEACRVS